MKKEVTKRIINRLDYILLELGKNFRCEIELTVDMEEELLEEYNNYSEEYDIYDKVFESEGKKGVVNIVGKVLVPAMFKDFPSLNPYSPENDKMSVVACDFNDKYALVRCDGKGTPLCDFEYDMITFLPGSINMFICEKRLCDKVVFGVLDGSGKIVVPCEMDEIEDPSNRVGSTYVYFTKGNKIGFLTMGGCYIEPQFDDVDICPKFLYVRKGDVGGFLSVDGEFIEENDKEKIKNKELLTFWSMNDYVHELLDGYEGLV